MIVENSIDRHDKPAAWGYNSFSIDLPDNPNVEQKTDYFEKRGIESEGFTDNQERWLAGAIKVIGLQPHRLRGVRREPIHSEHSDWAGSMNYSDQTLTMYSNNLERDNMPDSAPLRVADHEMWHLYCPTDSRNDVFYGGSAEREKVLMYVYNVAQQSIITNISLNGYHRELMDGVKSGEISHGRYIREVFAILEEESDFNREKLFETQERQRERLEIMKRICAKKAQAGEKIELDVRDLDFIELLGVNNQGKLLGADRIKAKLIKDVTDSESLNKRTAELVKYTQEHGNPFKLLDRAAN